MLRKNFIVQWMLFCLALFIVAGTMFYYLQGEYRDIRNHEGERLLTLNRALNRQISEELGAVYRVLTLIQRTRADRATGRFTVPFDNLFSELKSAIPGLQTILVTDASGNILTSSRKDILGPRSAFHASIDRVKARADAGVLHISEPFDTGMSKFAIRLMLMLPGLEGEFNGVVSATLGPDFFSALSPAVLFSDDMWAAIAHGDGLSILMVPHRARMGGVDLAQPNSFFTRHAGSGRTESLMTGTVYLTGEDRIMALHTINPVEVPVDRPLVLAVGRNLEDIYAEWRKATTVQTLFFLLSAFFIGTGLFLHQRKERLLRLGMADVAASLEMSEEFSRSILQTAMEGFVVLDLEGRLRTVNQTYCAMTGYSEHELLSLRIDDLEAIDDPEEIAERTREIIEAGSVRFESRHRRKDGTVFEVECSIQYSGSDGGCLIAFVRDITGRLTATQRLREALIKYRTLFDSFPVGVMVLDNERNIVETNRKAEKILGCSTNETPERAVERLQCRFVRADGTTFPEHEIASVRAQREQRLIEDVVVGVNRPSGEPLWFNVTAAPIPLDGQGVVVLFHDISARIQAEDALKLREEVYSSIVEQAMDAIVLIDDNGKFVEFSSSAHEGLGYTREEFSSLGIEGIQAEHSPEMIRQNIELCRAEGGLGFETRHRRRSGEIRDVRVSFKPIRVREREFFLAIWADITEQKRYEQELLESHQKFEAIVENIGIGVALISPDMEVLDMNRKMRAWFPDRENKSRPICFRTFNLPPADRICDWCPTVKTLQDGEVHENTTETPMGSDTVNFRVVSSPVFNERGEVVAAIEMVEDITQRLRLESDLRHAQRMQAIGNLAGGIAHDFNNILFPIVAFAEMLQEDLPAGSPARDHAREILQAGKRGADLVKQILTFSRKKEHSKAPTLLQQVIKEAVKLSRSTSRKNIEISDNLQQDCGPVMADATQLHQIGMNLITNACHAVENIDGRISVQVRETVLGAEETDGSPIGPGRYALLTVSDNGIGIPEANLNLIFDPYFTTKPKDKGTGLGLAVVYGIVKEYKGDIRVTSKPGKGTTFTVYLPILPRHEKTQSQKAQKDIEQGTERILLVDDEPSIADLVQRMLESLGYDVTAETDSTEALEKFRTNPENYDLVISDLSMPKIGGTKLAREILDLSPDTPVIICTGQGFPEGEAETIGISGVLLKPIPRRELANMVRTILDRQKALC
jgi:PAS domain S-box-containing protein